jgi:hypothetical protein
MAAPYVKVTDLRVGLPVEYLGESDPNVVLDEKLRARGSSWVKFRLCDHSEIR